MALVNLVSFRNFLTPMWVFAFLLDKELSSGWNVLATWEVYTTTTLLGCFDCFDSHLTQVDLELVIFLCCGFI